MKKSIICHNSGKSYIIETNLDPNSFKPRRPIDYFQEIRWMLKEDFGKKIPKGELITFLRRKEQMDYALIKDFLAWIEKDNELAVK